MSPAPARARLLPRPPPRSAAHAAVTKPRALVGAAARSLGIFALAVLAAVGVATGVPVLHPLPRVAGHVEQTVGAGGLGADVGGAPLRRLAVAAAFLAVLLDDRAIAGRALVAPRVEVA